MKMLFPLFLLIALIGCGKDTPTDSGHNGISFQMDRKQVESLGFKCKEAKADAWFSFSCQHMDMTGRAFGYDTLKYSVLINREDGKVAQVGAAFANLNKLSDYHSLSMRVKEFFPNQEFSSLGGSMSSLIYGDENKEKIALDYFKGVPPILPAEITVAFWSSKRPWVEKKD